MIDLWDLERNIPHEVVSTELSCIITHQMVAYSIDIVFIINVGYSCGHINLCLKDFVILSDYYCVYLAGPTGHITIVSLYFGTNKLIREMVSCHCCPLVTSQLIS
jgi:hypothetical protein